MIFIAVDLFRGGFAVLYEPVNESNRRRKVLENILRHGRLFMDASLGLSFYRLETHSGFVVGSWAFSSTDSIVSLLIYSLLVALNVLAIQTECIGS